MIEYYNVPVDERQVDVVHILKDGTVILAPKDFLPHQEKFEWVNITGIQRLVITLRPMTDSSRKSIIAIFETGEIKQYPNVSKNFTDYTLLNKSGL
jgi:hypothetical protein